MKWLYLFLGLLLISCNKEQQPLPKSSHIDTTTTQAISGAVLTAYDSANRIWVLTTENMIRTSDSKNSLKLNPVHLLMFDPAGHVTTTVTSDSGTTNDKMDSFYIWGNVYILNEDSSRIVSKSLSWSQRKRRLRSKDRVTISTNDGERISGIGFDATEDFSEWYFDSSVNADLGDFGDDMETDDDEE